MGGKRMSYEVWKYAIDATQRSVRTFDVPSGAQFLACGGQRDYPDIQYRR
jgi:hypothetical protein